MKWKLIIIWSCTILASCNYLKKEETKTPLARVNDNFLFWEDVEEQFGEALKGEDSLQVINNYINRWATQRLLIDQAGINLPAEKITEFEALIEQYRNDLYTEAYKSTIVSKQLDSTISNAELITFYERNKDNFRLNEEMFKLRYVEVENEFSNRNKLKEQLIRFNKEDKTSLSEMSIQFKSYNLNDSTWVKKDNLLKAIPVLQQYGEQVLKKGYFGELQDSIGVYLLKIEAVLEPNDVAPLTYVQPTIRQIILNQRKQILIQELEKDITRDAIKNNTFEIYQ